MTDYISPEDLKGELAVSFDQLPDVPEIIKDRYPFKCCNCAHKMEAEPSILMRNFSMNTASGKCTRCQTFMHLHIDGDHMVSQEMNEFIDQHMKR